MRKYCARQQVVQARIQKDEFQQTVMIWLPMGFAFFELIPHIFPKITWKDRSGQNAIASPSG